MRDDALDLLFPLLARLRLPFSALQALGSLPALADLNFSAGASPCHLPHNFGAGRLASGAFPALRALATCSTCDVGWTQHLTQASAGFFLCGGGQMGELHWCCLTRRVGV